MDKNGEKNPERWQLVEKFYHDALMLETSKRAAFVARACGNDPALVEEVMSLLAADDSAADFLRESVLPLGLEVLADAEPGSTGDTLDRTQPAPVDYMLGMLVGGRYEVTEKLGGGGMGDVYIALDKPEMARRRVVIKVLKEARLRDEWIVNKFRQEAEALTKINDGGVVGILDAGTLPDGKPYLVMQYVEGEVLRHYCKNKQERQKDIELEEVAEIVKQIGRTLDAAHRAGIVHRDLTPDNIMLHRNASGILQVKVIDFGIAKVKNSVLAPSTQTIHLAGTWQYMSPEQLQREMATPRSDIYALGVIAYELLTGRRPFHARTPIRLAELQKGGVKVMPQDLRPDDLPDSAQRAILRALSYNPAQRHQDAREFGDELSRALTEPDQETVAHPAPVYVDLETSTREKAGGGSGNQNEAAAPNPDPPTSERRWPFLNTPRHRRVAAVSALLVCLLGFVGWYFFREDVKPQIPETTKASQTGALIPERTLTYWFMVSSLKQPGMRPSLGTETFFTKEEFDIVAKPAQTGWLYLVNKGKDVNGNTQLVTLFPVRGNGNGDARLEANQERRIKGAHFTGGRGQEEIFFVWSAHPIEWLEQVFKESEGYEKSNNRYRLTEAGRAKWQSFHDTTALTESVEDEENSLLTLKGQGDVLVSVRRLKHADPP